MKKSTLAIAALLTTLSTATIMPAAYADDMAPTTANSCQGCKGCMGCKGDMGCKGCMGCKGDMGCTGS